MTAASPVVEMVVHVLAGVVATIAILDALGSTPSTPTTDAMLFVFQLRAAAFVQVVLFEDATVSILGAEASVT